MLAARFGSKEMCRYLLDSGETGVMAAGEFDVNGESPLFAAVKGGHVEFEGTAEMLHRAYPVHEHRLQMLEVKNVEGMTMLLWAAAHGRTEAGAAVSCPPKLTPPQPITLKLPPPPPARRPPARPPQLDTLLQKASLPPPPPPPPMSDPTVYSAQSMVRQRHSS